MGDYDDYSDYNNGSSNNSGGIFGTIISILILAAIWPYLLAAIALYIAYLAAVAVLDWMAQNPFTVVCILLGMASIYAVFHYRLISKGWRVLKQKPQAKPIEVHLPYQEMEEITPPLAERKFIPSTTNLYCYRCTKKLGVKAWEKNGKYYCAECNTKLG
jgi:hypothetical protein